MYTRAHVPAGAGISGHYVPRGHQGTAHAVHGSFWVFPRGTLCPTLVGGTPPPDVPH